MNVAGVACTAGGAYIAEGRALQGCVHRRGLRALQGVHALWGTGGEAEGLRGMSKKEIAYWMAAGTA